MGGCDASKVRPAVSIMIDAGVPAKSAKSKQSKEAAQYKPEIINISQPPALQLNRRSFYGGSHPAAGVIVLG